MGGERLSMRGVRASVLALLACVDVMCDRAEALDVAVDVQRRGPDGLEVSIEEDRERELEAIVTPAQLAFYDWEPNVFGDPHQPINGIADAIRLAARAKPRAEATDAPNDRENDSAGDKHYVLDRQGDLVRPGGAPPGAGGAPRRTRRPSTS